MKSIKIGQINFPKKYAKAIFTDIIDDLNKISNVKYEYANCRVYKCDIVFYSIYDKLENLSKVKGNPLLIYWTYEHMCIGPNKVLNDPFTFYKNNNLSISFYDDTDDNLCFPYFVMYLKHLIRITEENKKQYNKTKFCTFCASNAYDYHAKFRTNLVKYINKNYKTITCCGTVLNNTNNELLSRDFYTASVYHNDYKFNLCFENYESSGNLTYLTEKIVFAYMYNTVPIYWGAERVTEWFNENSFINCNGLTYKEILSKIKEIDNNNEQFQYMLHQQPMENIYDVYLFFIKKLDKFILSKL